MSPRDREIDSTDRAKPYVPPSADPEILKAQADAWQRCVDWFAYNGYGPDRVNMNLLNQAEEANPFDAEQRP